MTICMTDLMMFEKFYDWLDDVLDKFVWLTWWCSWQVCMTDLMFDKFVSLTWWCLASLYDWLYVWQVCMAGLMMFDKFVWLTWWCLTSLYDWLDDIWQVCMTYLMMFDKFVWLTWWCLTSLYDLLDDVWQVFMTDLMFYKYVLDSSFRPQYLRAWASYQIRKIAGSACAGNAGNVFPTTAG